jgi:GTP-binding protein
MMHIKKATYNISSPSFDKCPAPDRAEFAFIGRSNVGKSSLINMLCNNEKLAKTSSAPGKTQLINHFDIVSTLESETKIIEDYWPWYLVDLPGYGFAKVSISSRRRWEQMIENYLRKRENLTQLLVLIDARHSAQKIDIEFIENLKKWNIGFSIVFTKADKEKQAVVSKNVKQFLETLKKTWQFLPPHFVTSATKKQGKLKLLQFLNDTMVDLIEKPEP